MELVDLVLVVGMVGVGGVEEVELWVVEFVLSDAGLKLGAITCHEARRLVYDV